ncbi:MAG: hypothetical protein ACJAUP_001306 [Cellvibrionaceae bacterium]|jgi:hypothetical protein
MARKQERIELNQSIIITDVINGGIFCEFINVTTGSLMVMTKKNSHPCFIPAVTAITNRYLRQQ